MTFTLHYVPIIYTALSHRPVAGHSGNPLLVNQWPVRVRVGVGVGVRVGVGLLACGL